MKNSSSLKKSFVDVIYLFQSDSGFSKNFTSLRECLKKKLLEFYNKDGNMEKILPIINGESTISLRLVDWFATNYSKK